ncbi:salivary endonuclease-like [Nomia melanderi]|uniref:salivary endonuclease-like n=1 Tax=Nomia melanderi TaxID=2448451 RepID=UPI003FCEBF25
MLPFILLLACSYLVTATASGVCEIDISYNDGDLKLPQPLVLTSDSNEFFYPNTGKQSTLVLETGKSIALACPGAGNLIVDTKVQLATATCEEDKYFTINGISRNFSTIVCKARPAISANTLKQKCLQKYTSVAIGFEFPKKFLTTIEVCRDDQTYETYYTKFKLTKKIGHYQESSRPKNWLTGQYFKGMQLEKLYNLENQRTSINRILNVSDITKFVNESMYLSRGHLAARSDFVYSNQHYSTFHYLNAEPQWTTFNGGNWKTLEENVRSFSARNSLDLEVYTGVHGQMTMKDSAGLSKSIELNYEGSKPLSVPRFFWKIIYDPASKKGTAFVGLNDPFITAITQDVYLCKNRIESKIKWLTWSKELRAGASYACSVSELRTKISTIPPLNVVGDLI